MAVVDWILNLACLLLWLSWCSIRLGSLSAAAPISLLGTLRKADPREGRKWAALAALSGVLVVRGLFYRQIGSALNWTPQIPLEAVTIYFRSDRFWRIELYSLLAFGRWLFAFYAWLLLLSAVNRKTPDTDPVLRAVRRHLSRAAELPGFVKLASPMLVATVGWYLIHPALVSAGVVSAVASARLLGLQSLVIGAASLLLWKYLLIAILVIHLVNTYVYLGDWPFWQFASNTAKNLLAPFRRIPLQIGRLDLAPVFAVLVILGICAALETALPRLFQRL